MAEVVASVFAESAPQVRRALRSAAMAGADWLELRLDRWPDGASLDDALAGIRLPVLVACRTPESGGSFRGSLQARRDLLQAAVQAGAEGIDLELGEPWTAAGLRPRALRVVRSFHSFTGVPKELRELQAKLHQQPGAIAKIVVTAHDLADAAPVLELLQHTDQQQQPTVAFALGRTAWPTRVLAAALGAPLVYGCLEGYDETAPDQPAARLLAELYRVRELSPASSLYGLLGNPALHSLGPWLHNRCFRRQGRDAVYLPFETSRPEAVLAMLPARQLGGVSVTAPWKAAMAATCHQTDAEVTATGVVNTVVAAGHGLLTGHNTDVVGVRQALVGAGIASGTGRLGLVLGTGGAARAAVVALQQLGFAVVMLGRSLEPAREFAKQRGVQLGSLGKQLPAGLEPAVVVQSTPLGSRGELQASRPLPEWSPKPGTVVLDMVYQPYWTRFLRETAAAGAVPVPGAAMFLQQAAAQLRHFGLEAPAVEELRDCLAGTAVSALPLLAGG